MTPVFLMKIINMQKFWNVFEIKSMRQYHDLYIKSDVLILADIFENFRNVCRKNYGLDPARYYTSLHLAWDASLKLAQEVIQQKYHREEF